MVNHNRDDEKQEEEEKQADFIPKKIKRRTSRMYLMNNKQIFIWKKELFDIIEEMVEVRLPSGEIHDQVEEWVIDKFDLFLRNKFFDMDGKIIKELVGEDPRRHASSIILRILKATLSDIPILPDAYRVDIFIRMIGIIDGITDGKYLNIVKKRSFP